MPGTQELTRRIKSIKSTRKITRAMQMVSASKMRKSQQLVLASRSYAEIAWNLVENLSSTSLAKSSLLNEYRSATEVLVLAVSSNKGLVGSFNQNLVPLIKNLENQYGKVKLLAIGRKIAENLSRQKKKMEAEFPKIESGIDLPDVYPISRLIAKEYLTGNYRKVFVVYNHFVSTLVQKATARQLLPLGKNVEDGELRAKEVTEYLFEPEPSAVADGLLPRILESQLYRILLESDASEHSSRMIMMQNATEAAGELIDDLTLTFNQLRQSRITTELSEITAGKIALEGSN